MSHCTTAVLTWNWSMRIGNSTFVIVSVRMPTNAMMPTAIIERRSVLLTEVGNC